jgi:hypothetical protein
MKKLEPKSSVAGEERRKERIAVMGMTMRTMMAM